MVQAMTTAWGNPSSAHRMGAEAARLVERARAQVARAIGAQPAEVYFTSGGTEANALGVLGAAHAARGRHVVLSALEHPSVAQAGRRLAQLGWEVTVVAPEASGIVAPDRLAAAVRPDTTVCALMWVQNELGTIQPVAEAVRAVKARAPRCHVHSDAVQAVGKLVVDVGEVGVDSLALSAHKIHGPKGAGALYLRRGVRIEPLVYGGGQEGGVRPGTEGVPGVVGLGLAVELAESSRPRAAAEMASLRDQLWAEVVRVRPDAIRHGDPDRSAPHVLSLGLPHAAAEPLLHALEARDIFVSAGSACASKDKRPSEALRAIGVADHVATLRFSLSRFTTAEEIARVAPALDRALSELA
jgi:cysteine desulfurase